jgi:glycopeptide antibiotics resistance protein
MHTTSPWRAVSRVALVLGLFFTGCCFLDSWHAPFFFNFRYQWLKLILSFVIPAAVTVWNFLTERSLRFAGTACAVLMQVSLVLFFIDRYTVNLIARLDDSRIIYHFLYTLISVFTLLAAGWICARCSKACVDFALFYRRFSLGYLPLCAFLFILQFFLLRTFGNIFVTANGVPFRGEIYCLWYYAKTGTLVPVALSVFVESFQLLTKSGDADVDDIILNTLGAVLGVLIFRLLLRPLLQKETRIC